MKLRNFKFETSVLEAGNSGIEYKHERKRKRMHQWRTEGEVWGV
jgi:hypothetical protein